MEEEEKRQYCRAVKCVALKMLSFGFVGSNPTTVMLVFMYIHEHMMYRLA